MIPGIFQSYYMLLGSAVSLSLKQENVDSFFARWTNSEKKVPKTKVPPWVKCMDDQWMNVIFLYTSMLDWPGTGFSKKWKNINLISRSSEKVIPPTYRHRKEIQRQTSKRKRKIEKHIVQIVNHILFFYLLPFDKIVLFKYVSHL